MGLGDDFPAQDLLGNPFVDLRLGVSTMASGNRI